MDKNQLSKELMIRGLEKRNAKSRESFKAFVQTFYWRYFHREFMWNWHYELICDELEALMNDKEKRLLIINVPPQTGKSELVSKLFPLWCMGREDLKFIVAGYSSDLVSTFSGATRGYYESSEYRELFPRRNDLEYRSSDSWGTTRGSFYRSAGVGGSITGKPSDVFIIDDPLNPSDVAVSGLSMNRVNEWFSNVAMTRLSPAGRKKMVVVMQRLHDNDLTGYLLRNFPDKFSNGEFTHVKVPAYKDGESFFPAMFTNEELAFRKRTMTSESGEHYFSAQYMQDPVDSANAEFKREWFRYYGPSDESKIVEYHIAIDPAISEKQTADNTAIECVGRDLDGNYYLCAEVAKRMKPDEMMDELFAMQSAYKCEVTIEAISFQKVLIEKIRQRMKETGQFFVLHEITSRGNKIERIRAGMQPFYSNYRVFHRSDMKRGDYEEELVRFPKGRHDDRIDAVETAISAFRPLRAKGERARTGVDFSSLLGGINIGY